MKTLSLAGALLFMGSLGWSAYSSLDEESRKKFNEILDSAFNAYVNEKYDQALQIFQKALSMDPQDSTALKGLSECKDKIEQRRVERIRLQKDKLELVRKSIKDQDWVDAVDQVYNILQNAPTHAEALSLKSELEQLIRKKIAAFPVESSDRMIHEGILYYLHKRYPDAIQIWNEAKSLVSDQVKLTIYIQKAEHLHKEGTEYETLTLGRQSARAALESGNFEEAVNLWKKILEFTPDDEEAKKKYAQAQEMLQKKNRETMLGDYYDKGLALFLEGNFVESLKYWESILSISPENEVARDYAKKIRDKGVKSSSPKEISPIPSSAPSVKSSPAITPSVSQPETTTPPLPIETNPLTLSGDLDFYNQGLIFYQQGKYQDSIESFQKSLKRNPNDPKSSEQLELVLKEQKMKADEHYQKGLIAYSKGDVAEAIKQWQISLQIAPSHSASLRNLTKLKGESRP